MGHSMNRIHVSCALFLAFLAAGGFGWGHAVGHPYIGMAVAGLGPLALIAFVFVLAFFQDVWLPCYPRCKNGTCVGSDGYKIHAITDGVFSLGCHCGDAYVCTGSRAKGRVMKRVMPDGSTTPFKSHGRHGRWKSDDDSLPTVDRVSYVIECIHEFKWALRRRTMRREFLSAASRLDLGTLLGDEICWRVSDTVYATLYLWTRRREDTMLELTPNLYFRLSEVEKMIMGDLRGPRESFSQIGTIGFELTNLFGEDATTPWVLSDDGENRPVLDDLVSTVKEKVVPFVEDLRTVDAFVNLVTTHPNDMVSVPMSHYRMPVLFYLAEDVEEADRRLEQGLEATADWNSYSKSLYASYAERFRNLGRRSTGSPGESG